MEKFKESGIIVDQQIEEWNNDLGKTERYQELLVAENTMAARKFTRKL